MRTLNAISAVLRQRGLVPYSLVTMILCFSAGCSLDWGASDSLRTSDAGQDADVNPGSNGQDAAAVDAQGDSGTVVGSEGCWVDRDNDGFATELAESPCPEPRAPVGTPAGDCNDGDSNQRPGALDTCGDGVDNDCDGTTDEGVAEICNAQDDDCNGEPDHGLACVFGSTGLSCTTSCGSMGVGACSSSCEIPTGAACMPPAETCNWVDDDCDGLADEGNATNASTFTILTRDFDASQSGTALVPRKGGGVWALYRGAGGGAQPVSAMGFNSRGVSTGKVASVEAATTGSGFMAVDGDGDWTIVVTTKNTPGNPPPDNNRSLRVQIFDANMKLASENLSVQTVTAEDTVVPLRAAMLTDSSGVVHVVVFYYVQDGTVPPTGPTTYSHTTRMRVFHYVPGTKQWSASGENTIFQGTMFSISIGLARIPCRDEWLYAFASPLVGGVITRDVRRIGTNGAILGAGPLDTLTESASVYTIAAGQAACDSADPEMIVNYGRSTGGFLRRWQVDRASGSITQIGPDVSAEYRVFSRLTNWGGRWFIAAATGTMSSASAPLSLKEIDFSASPQPSFRDVVLNSQANPGNVFMNSVFETTRVDVRHAGEALMVSVPNSFQDAAGSTPANASNLETVLQQQTPGADNAMGVVYAVPCP